MSSNFSSAKTATSSAVLSDTQFLMGLSDNTCETVSSSDSFVKKAAPVSLSRKSKKIVKNKYVARQNNSKKS